MGRKKGSKNKKRGPGRPPGSTAKPHMIDATALFKALATAGIKVPGLQVAPTVDAKASEHAARDAARQASEKAKKMNLPEFALVIRDKKGEKIRALTGRTYDEAFAERRDWYKVLVLSMGQKVSMEIEHVAA